jgi:phage terminase large subunit
MIVKTLTDRNANDRVFNLIAPQAAFLKSESRYPAYVASWATGKSLTGIGKVMALSEEFPHNLGIVFRKEFTDLRDSTIKDFEKYTGLKVASGREVELSNGSQIMFRHIEELNNIQNVNLGWFWIEQAEELLTDEQFFTLFGRLRRKDCRHCGLITANTNGHNWIYKLWKLRNLEGGELFEAKTEDNAKNLPVEFLQSLEVLKTKKPKLYNRFVLNSWDESDTIDIIISPEWVNAAAGRDINVGHPIRRVVSIDVARYGDDKTIFYALENNRVLGKEEHEKRSTMEVVGLAQLFAKKHGDIQAYAVDEIGVGAGVADRLQELGKKVIFVNSSKKSRFPERYYNIRAEVYSMGADQFEAGKVEIQVDDSDLIEQLCWAKYKTIKSNGIYQVEAKEDIKERYGRSPDNADCFLNGLWALGQTATIAVKSDRYARKDVRTSPAVAIMG